jgi:predicted O-linked N-acetylglucosamine transferase (SPINDLY family)
VFAIWMNVMARVPSAVLWLLAPGVRARRICSASPRGRRRSGATSLRSHAPQEAHIARLRCADLALDTLPYGSHTTDATRSGRACRC